MTGSGERIPGDWDQLQEPLAADEAKEPASTESTGRVGLSALIGGAWGDLVSVLAVCTTTLAVLAMLGYGAPSRSVPWAAAISVLWWLAAALVLIVVRHGTPGMLMAGVVFSEPVPRRRLGWLVLASLITWSTLGLPSVGGADRALVRWAAGVRLRAVG
jgi:hypothetical protein